MRRTYQEASKVLALDSSLMVVSKNAPVIELYIRLNLSSWMRQLGTFQEAFLAADVHIQFSDGTQTMRHIAESLQEELSDSQQALFTRYGQLTRTFFEPLCTACHPRLTKSSRGCGSSCNGASPATSPTRPSVSTSASFWTQAHSSTSQPSSQSGAWSAYSRKCRPPRPSPVPAATRDWIAGFPLGGPVLPTHLPRHGHESLPHHRRHGRDGVGLGGTEGAAARIPLPHGTLTHAADRQRLRDLSL